MWILNVSTLYLSANLYTQSCIPKSEFQTWIPESEYLNLTTWIWILNVSTQTQTWILSLNSQTWVPIPDYWTWIPEHKHLELGDLVVWWFGDPGNAQSCTMRVFFMCWIFKALSSTVYLSLTSWSFPILATAASIATAIGFNLTCIQPQHNFQRKVRNLPSCLSLRSCMGLEAMGSLHAKKMNILFIN